jgi:prepilin-type N-terminal cleavage/methylation domain-containing protein
MKPFPPNHPVQSEKAEGMKFPSGFTMIELLIIIVIIGIVAVIALASFESLVYGASSNRAVLELVSDLQLARMKAVQIHGPVTVTFNAPINDQYSVAWTDTAGTPRIRTVQLDPRSRRVSFDMSPPGGGTSDASFTFNALGFYAPDSDNRVGFIYLVDTKNQRRFGIATTVAGGIDQRAWSDAGGQWSGPEFIFSSDPLAP